MPRTGPKKLYKVSLSRKGAKTITFHTQAASPKQARRFAQSKLKGYTVLRIRLV